MKEFEFKKVDFEGEETLEAIASANRFNEWMYKTIAPHCGGKILEIGSGIGNISDYFIQSDQDITLSDIRSHYCSKLAERYPHMNPEEQILELDIAHPNFDQHYAAHIGKFDTVFALNVVEHIKDHEMAIANCHKLLRKNGKIIILVPAFQSLYNRFDRELEHYRRYNRQALNALLQSQHFEIVDETYFNSLGILGWYVSGRIQKNKTIPSDQVKIFNLVVPIAKVLDHIFLHKVGLSVISVGQKNQ